MSGRRPGRAVLGLLETPRQRNGGSVRDHLLSSQSTGTVCASVLNEAGPELAGEDEVEVLAALAGTPFHRVVVPPTALGLVATPELWPVVDGRQAGDQR